jgi:hypothetical protein
MKVADLSQEFGVILARSESPIPIWDDAVFFSSSPHIYMGPIVACREGGGGWGWFIQTALVVCALTRL